MSGAFPLDTMHFDYIEYHAQARPNLKAVLDLRTGEEVTWAELHDLVCRTAGMLNAMLGNPAGERVVVLTRSSLDTLLLHYACDRVGAIFVPLNWRLAGAELSVLLADCAPKLAVIEDEFAAQLEQAAGAKPDFPVLVISSERNALREKVAESAPAPHAGTSGDLPWTLLYTSGTTGRPKGVIITRHNAMWGSTNLAFLIQVNASSVMLCDPPMFHTVGLFGISRTATLTGARLIISDRFTPGVTLERFSDKSLGVTHYFGVPQIGQMLLDEPGFADADLSTLKAIIMGGAPLPAQVAEGFAARGVPVLNGFGMTEGMSIMHMPFDIPRILERPSHTGFPGPFIEVRIADPDGVTVPDGEVGELYLRGPTVTPGYWNQPEATAAAFRDGWFMTGDLGIRAPDGCFQIVDRRKDMYISGGENVYPAEVEAVIRRIEAVAEVGVVGVANERWGEVGVACIVVRPGMSLTEAEVAAHCKAKLAGYKRPAEIRFFEALPRNAAGKIRKDILRQTLAG